MTQSHPESNLGTISLVVLATLASGYTLYALADILTPPALAMFLAIVIDGFARVLKAHLPWMPRRAAMPLALTLSVLVFGAAMVIIAENGSSFVTQLITYTPRLNALIAKGAGLVHVDMAPTIDQLMRRIEPAKYLGTVAQGAQAFASNALFILIYLGFIMASRHVFEKKLIALSPTRQERHDALAAFVRIRNGVEQYLWVQTVTGVMIAVASWAAMAAFGLHNAIFWAFLIFVASYIPIIGGAIGIVAPPVFALIQFEPYWPALVLFGLLQAIQFVVGNVILPRMQGDSLNIDPVVVLLSLAFWGAIWGVTGMFLSTPLTVMAMVVLSQFPGTRWVAILLSANGNPMDGDPPPSVAQASG